MLVLATILLPFAGAAALSRYRATTIEFHA